MDTFLLIQTLMKDNRKLWQWPWRYKESFVFILGLMLVGFALQLIVGSFNFYLLASPINYTIGGLFLIFFGFFSYSKRKTKLYTWLTSIPFSVTLIGGLLILSIFMGSIPQRLTASKSSMPLYSQFGFDAVTSMWSFVILYFLTLLSLGLTISKKLWRLQKKDFIFHTSHIGLWVLLFAAGLGSADMKRYVMHIPEGEVEWRVYSPEKDILELPIAIQLHDFIMEEYPPQLALINKTNGKLYPDSKKSFFSLDSPSPIGELGPYQVELKKYIHNAIRSSDTLYREAHMPGATPAAHITVKTNNNLTKTGWVSGGNAIQLFSTIDIDSIYSIVMTRPEPKRFLSKVDIFTKDGKEYLNQEIEVNKPFKTGDWTIYQYGYDNEAGKLSSYTSLELVYDPWLTYAYIGIGLLFVSSIALVIQGKPTKSRKI